MKKFDAIIIGAGHAGVEAAFILAKAEKKVALVSPDLNKAAMMPCNPSIGGPAKGILTREIDALGGVQGYFADQAMIQIKMLNESKGPAVRALRAQIDKEEYSKIIKEAILKSKNITFIENIAKKLLYDGHQIVGALLNDDEEIFSSKVLLTTGTYLDSKIFIGEKIKKGSPDDQEVFSNISTSLKEMGFTLQRLKTGTPPRVKSSSIDFSKVEKEVLELKDFSFSEHSGIKLKEQISCYLTYTTPETHKIIQKNMNRSSMYSGAIKGVGPRYCPSIEDKIVRFANKDRHQVFYEPETKEGDIIYVQGLSTSMPIDIQEKMVKSLPGMKNAIISKWGYAIEYDAIDPLELKPSLESKKIKGLFFAGQINGSSGYEEAAAQGLIAGINIIQSIKQEEPLIIQRNQAYIGVLIDDLITKGTKEPYRMLTSRAEYRLLLRNDNADERLFELAYKFKTISEEKYQKVKDKYLSIIIKEKEYSETFLSSNSPYAKKHKITNGPSILQLLSRPETNIYELSDFKYIYEIAIRTRLSGYIKKQENEARKMIRLEKFKIPQHINYQDVLNLATEARQKLEKIKPLTIGQASRVSGITPADIQMLMFYIEYSRKKNEN